MFYYGTRLSENISRREPEGYLLCLNVPVARTGIQQYLPEELGLPPGGAMIPVYRPEEEVFSRECIASFEGMPVTNDHPPDGVSLENIRRLQKGHAHNVRRGTGPEADLLLADLMITDQELIDAILSGKREISCGYTYELSEEDGRYVQCKIRGNHVAVVDAGRAGPRVSIRDRHPEAGPDQPTCHMTERSQPMKKKTIARVLARMARDGDVEGVAEILEEMMNQEETAVPAVPAGPLAVPATEAPAAVPTVPVVQAGTSEEPLQQTQVSVDCDLAIAILERLDRLITLLSGTAMDEEPQTEVSEKATAQNGTQPAAQSGAQNGAQTTAQPGAQNGAQTTAQPGSQPGAQPAAQASAQPATQSGEEDPLVQDMVEEVEKALESMVIEEGSGYDPNEIGELVESLQNPTSDIVEPDSEEEEETAATSMEDALRAALATVRPALMRMPMADRNRVCKEIASRIRGNDTTVSDEIRLGFAHRGNRNHMSNPADLGQRIMATRNANFHKN